MFYSFNHSANVFVLLFSDNFEVNGDLGVADNNCSYSILDSEETLTISSVTLGLSKPHKNSEKSVKTVAFHTNVKENENRKMSAAVSQKTRHDIVSDAESEEETDEPENYLYPGLYPTVFYCASQTSKPRIWCLRIVANPYPFTNKSTYYLVILYNTVINFTNGCISTVYKA